MTESQCLSLKIFTMGIGKQIWTILLCILCVVQKYIVYEVGLGSYKDKISLKKKKNKSELKMQSARRKKNLRSSPIIKHKGQQYKNKERKEIRV